MQNYGYSYTAGNLNSRFLYKNNPTNSQFNNPKVIQSNCYIDINPGYQIPPQFLSANNPGYPPANPLSYNNPPSYINAPAYPNVPAYPLPPSNYPHAPPNYPPLPSHPLNYPPSSSTYPYPNYPQSQNIYPNSYPRYNF